MISLPGYDSWRSNADGYERPEYEDLDECALAQQGDAMTTALEDKMRAFDAWLSDADAETLLVASDQLESRKLQAHKELASLQADIQAKLDRLAGKPPLTKKEPVQRKTRKDKGRSRVSRNAAASNDTSEDAEVAS
jgi:hypothetical protein